MGRQVGPNNHTSNIPSVWCLDVGALWIGSKIRTKYVTLNHIFRHLDEGDATELPSWVIILTHHTGQLNHLNDCCVCTNSLAS